MNWSIQPKDMYELLVRSNLLSEFLLAYDLYLQYSIDKEENIQYFAVEYGINIIGIDNDTYGYEITFDESDDGYIIDGFECISDARDSACICLISEIQTRISE